MGTGMLIKKNRKLMKEWDKEKNSGISLNNLLSGSNRSVWWKCDKGHSWEDTVNHRNAGRNCPYCSNHRILAGFNDLATTHPLIANDWDKDKNELTAKDVVAGSHKKVWWKCSRGHEYEATIKDRTNGANCPYCVNRRILSGFNDFATKKPELMKEWNYEKNIDVDPTLIFPNTHKKVWWRCKHGHEWMAYVNNRTNGSGCPICQKNTNYK